MFLHEANTVKNILIVQRTVLKVFSRFNAQLYAFQRAVIVYITVLCRQRLPAQILGTNARTKFLKKDAGEENTEELTTLMLNMCGESFLGECEMLVHQVHPCLIDSPSCIVKFSQLESILFIEQV